MNEPTAPASPLVRGIGLRQAVALNVNNMIGIGPFITIPIIVTDMAGPQALYCWLLGAAIAFCDGLVWAELSGRLPRSGGTYVYLRESYGPRWGRLMSFLFLWQVAFQGPLSFAGGAIGFTNYLAYLWPGLPGWGLRLTPMLVTAFVTVLLYRRISTIGQLGVWLAAAAMIALVATSLAGFISATAPSMAAVFDRFGQRPESWWGLGDGTRRAIYAYLGYYNVCFLGDEVRDSSRTIPRSILLAVTIVAILYLAMNVALLGGLGWEEVARSRYVAAIAAQRSFGSWAGSGVALLVLWTAIGSLFALTLANSRTLFAAARDGRFFAMFARVHPRDRFPTTALIALGTVAAMFTWLPLGTVITSLIVIRSLVQFIGQNIGLALLRRRRPDLPAPFRMWLYPLPSVIALGGWLFIFITSKQFMVLGLAFIASGIAAFLVHQRIRREWPFA